VRRRAGTAALAFGVVLLAGCAHYLENVALERHWPAAGYRFEPVGDPNSADELFVCLTLSGGGTRASALAYGVLQKLRETMIPREGRPVALLDEVDCISSVSGGSFTAAYYALFGPRLFQDFYARFLTRNIERELVWRALNPANAVRLASPYWSRIDLAAELYDETVFDRKTFAAVIERGGRPFVILNATNVVSGQRFEFTQDQFDLIGSDLAAYPVARAVAASSAFPFLLDPLSLVNRARADVALSPEYANALRDRETNRRRYEWAREQTAYLDAARRPYIHLLDGGLSDNIGLRAVTTAYQRSSGFLAQRVQGRIKRLVIVVVNAKPSGEDRLSRQQGAPGLFAVGLATATAAMENYSFETIEVMKELTRERQQAEQSIAACQRILDESCPGAPRLPTFPAALRTCVVEVGFDAIEDEARRTHFLRLPTSFYLPTAEVDALIAVGGELLDGSADFQRLLRAVRDEPALGEGIGERGNCS
jgi:predicted acylesterase/phospholipase RssA